jgi:hypothetical protein
MNCFRTQNANSDASKQSALVQLLIAVAEGHQSERDLVDFFLRHAWPRSIVGKRLVYALRKVELHRPDLYPRVRQIVEPIFESL